MINIRKLAAVDMAWLGAKIIIPEYVLGILGPFVLGVISIRSGLSIQTPISWVTVLGIWLVSIGVNYIPLFIYAVIIARAGTVKEEGGPEIVNAKRYGVQQAMILVPFLVAIIAIVQEQSKRQKDG
jgi:hypothetical protein